VGQDRDRGQATTRVDQDQPAATPDPARPGPLVRPGRCQRALPGRVRLYRRAPQRRDDLPLCQLRYNGSASICGLAIYLASRDGYEDNILPSGLPAGSPEEAPDCACGLYLYPDELTTRTTQASLPLLSGHGRGGYRCRVHARGRDTMIDGTADTPVEDYLIEVGPEGERLQQVVHRQSDRYGAELRDK
jgi:hypothetical protein